MATVINATELRRAFITLGWDNVGLAETQEWLASSGISPEGVLGFCEQMIAHPEGMDTTAFVAPVLPNELPYIIEHFQGAGVVY